MKKKILIISITGIIVLLLIILSFNLYNRWRIANAEVYVKLIDNLNIEVYTENVYVSNLIEEINGNLVKDKKIKTTKLGEQIIDFEYINNQNIRLGYTIKVNIVDKTPPVIFSGTTLSVKKGYTGNLEKELFCGDNYDDNPKCIIEGTYDVNTPGDYNLIFKGIDSSKNISSQNFVLTVKEKNTSTNTTTKNTNFSDVITKYKNETTKIGIDVSKWQGDIDFQQVKNAGVEFVFIRIGSQKGIGGEYFLDPKFEQNIKGFQEVGIPVGIYFYSYADSNKAAKKEAEWIIEKLKPYKIELPIVFDWECWSLYQEFNKSFYHLTEMANTYLSTIEKAGYKGMLYSSKNYLEKIWFKTKYPTWLAHYTEQTTYQGTYKVWQMCSNGKVPGITGTVDINIMYN